MKKNRPQGHRALKMILPIVAVILVSMSFTAWLNYLDAKRLLVGSLEKYQALACREMANELYIRINKAFEIADIVASLPVIRQAAESGHFDQDELRAVISKISNIHNDSNNIFIIDKSGNVIADIYDTQINVAHRDYFKTAMTGRKSLGNIYGVRQNQSTPFLAVPITNSYEVVGVLLLAMDIEKLASLWEERLSHYKNSRISVYDNNSELILSSYNILPSETASRIRAHQDIVNKPMEKLIPMNIGDTKRMGMHISVPDFDWTVIVSSHEDTVFAPIKDLFIRTIIINCLAGFIFIACIIALVLKLLETIRRRELRLEQTNEEMEKLVAKRTEELLEKNNLFQLVMDTLPDIFYVKDKDDHIIGCNKAFLNITNLSNQNELTGKTTRELFAYSPEMCATIIDNDKIALDSAVPIFCEESLLYDDNIAVFDSVKCAYRDINNQVLGIVGISRDITQRKYVEMALQQSQQEAQAASKAKSEFLANMSHEIRTPLNGIIGLNYLAMQAEPNHKLTDYLLKIEKSAHNLLSIINDILDFSKIEAGKMELEKNAFRLKETVSAVLETVSPAIKKPDLKIMLQIDENIPEYLQGDELRFSQILLNLFSNAIKFTPHGHVDISLKVTQRTQHEICIQTQIKDTGIGISHDQIKKLFTAFTQADSSTTRKYGGTGLGLAITKRLIELMRGEITVQSQPNQGSIFSFTVFFELLDQKKWPVPKEKNQIQNTMPLENIKILLAEDNEINQMIACELLNAQGAEIEIATDGLQAVNMALTNEYDLILMDIQMPHMDGLEATRILRREIRLDQTPIIAMTAHAMNSDRDESLEAGMQDHITKPIDPALMVNTVINWLKKTD